MERVMPPLSGNDRETIAENAIFRGDFDHWGEIDNEIGRYECGNCGGRGRNLTDATGKFRRHLQDQDLGAVIEAIGQRP